jgi:hypothetical protein
MSKLPNFKQPVVPLSEEHARQVERFTGVPYHAVQDAALKGYLLFKAWHHRKLTEREQKRRSRLTLVGKRNK